MIIDRATSLANNAIADAVTCGFTRPTSFVAQSPTAATVIFDPILPDPSVWITEINDPASPPLLTTATLKAAGVAAATTSTTLSDPAVARLFCQARDDLVFTPPAGPDDPPTNSIVNGIRSFQGRTSCLIALTEANSGSPPLAAGDLATLSVVVFHNRDTVAPLLSATLSTSGLLTLAAPPPDSRSIRSIIRPGVVLAVRDAGRIRFARLAMAAADATSQSAYISLVGKSLSSSSSPWTAWVLVDSVSLLEQTIRLEGPNAYLQ